MADDELDLGPLPGYVATQALEQQSLDELRCMLPSSKFIVRDLRGQDEGADGSIEVVVDDQATNFSVQFQLKARTHPGRNADGSRSLSLPSSSFNYLLNARSAIVLLFDAGDRSLYWVSVLAEHQRLRSEGIDHREQKSITLRFTQQLQPSTVHELHAWILEPGLRDRLQRQEADGVADGAILQNAGAPRRGVARAGNTALDEAWPAEMAALRRRTERIHVVGCDVYLPQREALRLCVAPDPERGARESRRQERGFEARYLLEQDVKAILVSGLPGSGKSKLCALVAACMAEQRRVLHGPLSDVARRLSRGESFLAALGGATCEGRYDEARFARLLGGAEALLLDGLDETGMHRAEIVDELAQWPQRFPDMRLVVTDRPSAEATSLLSAFQAFTILPPEDGEIGVFVERVATEMRRRSEAQVARRRVGAALSARPELRTPLLLGFLTALALAGDDDLAGTPALLYERVLILMGRSSRVDRRYAVTMAQSDADAVLDELAWVAHVDRHAELSLLMMRIAEGLAERQIGGGDPRTLAEQGVSFWVERGLLKRTLRPARDDLELVHATFKDFAAGRRLSRRDDAEIASFAAAASSTEDLAILSVAASRGASATVVDAMLAAGSRDPDRILACARAVMHAELSQQAQARLVEALATLIEHATIPTYAADAGEALADLVDTGRVEVARACDAVGDHDALAEDARRLAALRVRVACVGQGATGKVSVWIADQVKQLTSLDHDFKMRSFSARRYLNAFLPVAVRVVALREGEQVAGALVRDLVERKQISIGARMKISQWAHQEGRSMITDAARHVGPEWMASMEEVRNERRRDLDGDLGFLATLELACGTAVARSSDGSALALVESCSGLEEVAIVDFRATFSWLELRPQLVILWEAWLKALDIDPGRLRHDIVEARGRLEVAAEAGLGSVFSHLPMTPVRQPVWSRVDFSDPALAPKTLIAWMRYPLHTTFALAMPILFAHPQRSAVVDAILEELVAPARSFLLWLSMIGDKLDDARLVPAICTLLSGAWPRDAHHLLGLLDGEALRRPEIQARVIAALESDVVAVVEAAVGAVLRTEPIVHPAIEAARAAFDRWTERQQAESSERVRRERGGVEIRTVLPTPRGALATLMVLGPTGPTYARALLDDEDHSMRDIALACVRNSASCEVNLEVIVQSVRAADLIGTLIHRSPLRKYEIAWMCRTVRRPDLAEETRLALVDAFAEAKPGVVPEDTVHSTLRSLCEEDGAVAIRDRALNALRIRGSGGA